MKFEISVVSLIPSNSTPAVRAHANIRISSDAGSIKILGFSVVEPKGKPPWVGFPKKPGKAPNQYYPVVEAEGKLKELIANAILDAYKESKN